jgi:uncharacterized protein YbaP (TraB family)
VTGTSRRGRGLRVWRRTLVLIVSLTAGTAVGQPAPAAFDTLPTARAMAVVPERPDQAFGIAFGQPHDLAATFVALDRCRAAANSDDHCEVLWQNDRRITTGAEIRARVPAEPHPLFLWHYDGGASQVYLAGSIHVLKHSLYPLPPEYEAAFQESDHLVVEVDLERTATEEIQRRTLSAATLPDRQRLRDLLPPLLYARLERRLETIGTTAAQLDGAMPALVMNQLLIARLTSLGYSPDHGLEGHFLRRRGSRPVLELESLDSQLELLFGQPLPTQIQLLEEALDTEQEIEPILAELLVAWMSGDDERFLALFGASSGDGPAMRAYQKALLDDRNEAMAAAVRDLLEFPDGAGNRYFVLVGSAHLVGEHGIVNVLARQGVRGRRLWTRGP